MAAKSFRLPIDRRFKGIKERTSNGQRVRKRVPRMINPIIMKFSLTVIYEQRLFFIFT